MLKKIKKLDRAQTKPELDPDPPDPKAKKSGFFRARAFICVIGARHKHNPRPSPAAHSHTPSCRCRCHSGAPALQFLADLEPFVSDQAAAVAAVFVRRTR